MTEAPVVTQQEENLFFQVSKDHLDLLKEFYRHKPSAMTGWSRHYRLVLASYYRQMIPDHASVLEIGCGDGTLLEMLPGSEKTGVDLSEIQVEKARQRLPHATFYVSPGELFQADKTYDYIVISDTLNEVADCQMLFKRLLQASHPQTRLIINIFNTLWRPILDLARFFGAAAPVPAISWLTTPDVINFLELSDWELVRYSDKILLPISDRFIARTINRWVTPFFSWFALTHFLVARKRSASIPEKSISILVPARNEAGNLEAAIRRVPEMSPDQEWVFIEGGSKDNTWDLLQKLPALFPDKKIKILQQTGKGKANAIHEGVVVSTGEILMILDADLTMPPEELPKYYDALTRGEAELANGVRLVYPMDKRAMPFLNLCVNKFFAILFTWIVEQPVKDTLCGTKVLTRKHYDAISLQKKYFGDFDPFGDFEVLFGAARMNLKIRDIPIRYKERVYGQTNIERWKHGAILLRMAAIGATKLKFI